MAVGSALKAPRHESIGSAVAVQVFPAFRRRAPVRLLKDAARAALAVGGAAQGASAKVGVVVADDETVRTLNARYRGLDETTDVLSFSWASPGHWEGEGHSPLGKLGAGSSPFTSDVFPAIAGARSGLGEVIISYPQAERQAREHGHATRDELALLVAHGVLHLQGHDHETPADEARMRALESRALAGLSIGITLIGRTLLERSGHGG
ncbi:MAG: rRNA maturation RNase YbeY [Dehalococcoidia bacterium]|nr:rRNA maturation RNase YbeY [Dehalococcoidia bacterium]